MDCGLAQPGVAGLAGALALFNTSPLAKCACRWAFFVCSGNSLFPALPTPRAGMRVAPTLLIFTRNEAPTWQRAGGRGGPGRGWHHCRHCRHCEFLGQGVIAACDDDSPPLMSVPLCWHTANVFVILARGFAPNAVRCGLRPIGCIV